MRRDFGEKKFGGGSVKILLNLRYLVDCQGFLVSGEVLGGLDDLDGLDALDGLDGLDGLDFLDGAKIVEWLGFFLG